MTEEQIFAFMYGLSLLSADEMRELLLNILTFDTERKVEGAVEHSYFSRKSINDKMLEKLKELQQHETL